MAPNAAGVAPAGTCEGGDTTRDTGRGNELDTKTAAEKDNSLPWKWMKGTP